MKTIRAAFFLAVSLSYFVLSCGNDSEDKEGSPVGPVGSVYPKDTVETYLNACMATASLGMTDEEASVYCNCTLGWFEANVDFEVFIAEEQKVLRGEASQFGTWRTELQKNCL